MFKVTTKTKQFTQEIDYRKMEKLSGKEKLNFLKFIKLDRIKQRYKQDQQ